MASRSSGGIGWWGLAAVLSVSFATMVGCSEEAPDDGNADRDGGPAGGSSAGRGDEGALSCDCGELVHNAQIPLSCACAAGLCTTFEQDVARYRAEPVRIPSPYYVLLGTCADGYRTIKYENALENSGESTYDADGNLVFRRDRGYEGVVPEACGFETKFLSGNITIGEDPAPECSYCMLVTDDASANGAAGAGNDPRYPARGTAPCDPSDLE